MPVPSLYELAKSRLIRNIDNLEDVGDLPYHFLRPVLLKIQNPAQLRKLEKNCPQLAGEDAEIWQNFIKRDIPDWESKQYEPKNPQNWWKVYERLKKESEEEMLAQEAALRSTLQAKAKEKAKHTAIISDKPLAPQKRYRSGGWGSTNPTLPPKNSRNVMDRITRQVKEASAARPKAMLMPTHLLQQRAARVKQAPKGLVDDKTRKIIAPLRGSFNRLAGVRPPDTSNRNAATKDLPDQNTLLAREARLKALTSSSGSSKSALTSDVPSADIRGASLPTDNSFKVPRVPPKRVPEPTVGIKRKREANIFLPSAKRRP